MTEKFKNLEKTLENLDWKAIHKDMVLDEDFNNQIIIWYDGEVTSLGSGSTPNTDNEYLTLITEGLGNIDTTAYSDGWATYDDETGKYTDDDTGEIMSLEEMISECIDTGDHSDWVGQAKERLIQQYNDDYVNRIQYYLVG